MKGYSPIAGGLRRKAHIKVEAEERDDPTRAIRRLGTLAGSLTTWFCPSLEQPEPCQWGPSWNTGLATKPSMTHKPLCNISTLNIFSAGRDLWHQCVYKKIQTVLTFTTGREVPHLGNEGNPIENRDDFELICVRREERHSAIVMNSPEPVFSPFGINWGWHKDTCIESEVVEA